MDMMEHKHKGGAGWIVGLIILVAALIIVSMVAPRSVALPEGTNQQQATQQSDELESIGADIDSSLETDLDTSDLGY